MSVFVSPQSTQRTEPVMVGIDVGSTTVKAVVVDPQTKEFLWSDYQRHQTKQAEFVLDFLQRIREAFPKIAPEAMRIFITGSGASPIAPVINAKFVQEVNAVTLAVETLHPDVGSVVELGGQDAKIIIIKKNEKTGDKQASTSMNDKCASGTGATIDKCILKVALPNEEVVKIQFDDTRLHHVAAKCGVFAETDIVGQEWHSRRRDHELAGRCDRDAEPVGADPWQHAAPEGPSAWWTEHLSAIFARLLAQAHSRDMERSWLSVSEGRATRGADDGS